MPSPPWPADGFKHTSTIFELVVPAARGPRATCRRRQVLPLWAATCRSSARRRCARAHCELQISTCESRDASRQRAGSSERVRGARRTDGAARGGDEFPGAARGREDAVFRRRAVAGVPCCESAGAHPARRRAAVPGQFFLRVWLAPTLCADVRLIQIRHFWSDCLAPTPGSDVRRCLSRAMFEHHHCEAGAGSNTSPAGAFGNSRSCCLTLQHLGIARQPQSRCTRPIEASSSNQCRFTIITCGCRRAGWPGMAAAAT